MIVERTQVPRTRMVINRFHRMLNIIITRDAWYKKNLNDLYRKNMEKNHSLDFPRLIAIIGIKAMETEAAAGIPTETSVS